VSSPEDASMHDLAGRTRAWACYDCGKCTATCPISRAGAAYSPRKHVLETNLFRESEIRGDESLAVCLTCSQCDERCPVQVDYTNLVQGLRELVYDPVAEPECPHGGALQSIMRMMALGGTQQARLDWLDSSLDVGAKKGKVFYWTGCTMYYDAFFTDLGVTTLNGTKAALRLLNAMGEKPVVSPDERCCGHDLLWTGDRRSFEALARHNIGLVEKSGAELLVTSCAECLRTWKLDYRPYYGKNPPKIMHITEILAERWDGLKLGEAGKSRVTFQDPCRLGRHLGIYDPPRKALSSVEGIEFAEMEHSGPGAVCCAGGTWSNCDRYAKKIQVQRLREARSTGAGVLATACPKCQVHFRCAMKDPNIGDDIKIELRDVAEIVAEALQ
jgi:heterodisulfide reductase subunit D